MGFLGLGTPLTWEETSEHRNYIREHGVQQFLCTYDRVKGRKGDPLFWGDEIEYHIVTVPDDRSGAKVVLRAPEILADLQEVSKGTASWVPEYGKWMVEGTPEKPYGGFTADLCDVEHNMRLRRRLVQSVLHKNEMIISMVAFPLMGVGDFCVPSFPPNGPVMRSLYIPDEAMNPHPRFPTLTRNIRHRRGRKVSIHVPVFKDKNTVVGDEPASTDTSYTGSDPIPSDIYMDSMAFGMGCCCLQTTFQSSDLSESRYLHDQLSVISPIMMALTAASPIFKGLLADTDARWGVIRDSTDCRTAEESSPGEKNIAKPRYDSIDSFISNAPQMKGEKYNDVKLVKHDKTYEALLAGGVDPILAQHVAHLFIRDPLVIFSDRVELDDTKSTEHFENFQSTNWQNVRWKPPPPSGPVEGWRVELRTMEVQITDFENAAFTVFSALLSRAILFFNLNLYIPISKVDANLATAHLRDALTEQKFYFRKFVIPLQETCNPDIAATVGESEDIDSYDLFSVHDILMGRGESFPGLIPLIFAYLDLIKCKGHVYKVVEGYMNFISKRARGELLTPARWIRNFVTSHPDYKFDSVVSGKIAADLLHEVNDVACGVKSAPSLLGSIYIPKIDEDDRAELSESRIRLRGGSFSGELTVDGCKAIHDLIAAHSIGLSFEETTPFLKLHSATPIGDSKK